MRHRLWLLILATAIPLLAIHGYSPVADAQSVHTIKKIFDAIRLMNRARQLYDRVDKGGKILVDEPVTIGPELITDLNQAQRLVSSRFVELDIPEHKVTADEVFSQEPDVRKNSITKLEDIGRGQDANLLALEEGSKELGRLIESTDTLIPFYERYRDQLEKIMKTPSGPIAESAALAWVEVTEDILPSLVGIRSDAKKRKGEVDETVEERRTEYDNFNGNLETIRLIHEAVIAADKARGAFLDLDEKTDAAARTAASSEEAASSIGQTMESMSSDVAALRATVSKMVSQAIEHAEDRRKQIEALQRQAEDQALEDLGEAGQADDLPSTADGQSPNDPLSPKVPRDETPKRSPPIEQDKQSEKDKQSGQETGPSILQP